MEFKENELGNIIKEIIDYRGKTPKKLGGNWSKNGIKAISAKNIKKGKIVQPETIRFIDKNLYKKWMKQEVDRGTILITSEAPFGEIFYWDSDEKIVLSQRIFGLKIKQEYNSKFIYYYMSTKKFQNELKSRATGSTVIGLRQPELLKCKIEIPNRRIQDSIVKILNSLDKKIELNNQINNNLYKIGKTYYQNWAENCVEKIAIKEVAEEILDYTKNLNSKVKLINSSDVTRGNFSKFEFVENKNLKGHFKKNFKKYDILYSQIRPRNHHYGYVLFDDTNDYIASTRLMVIRNKKEKISSSLLYFSIIANEAIEDFTAKTESRSGTFPQGNYEDLSSYKIKYRVEQEEITKLLDSILEKIYLNQQEVQSLESLRDALLPKLMNGEINIEKINMEEM